MIDPEEFEAVFGSNKNISYDAKTVEKIQANRDKVGGELMVEKLLKTLGVDAGLTSLIMEPAVKTKAHVFNSFKTISAQVQRLVERASF